MTYAISVGAVTCPISERELDVLVFRLDRAGVVHGDWRSPSAALAHALCEQRDEGRSAIKVPFELTGTLLETLQLWSGAEDFSDRLSGLRYALYAELEDEAKAA
ncbi:MAG TPA: hypothetical protein VMB53_00995 [Gaiellaceae bacterium]|nr:hypothetical protein [Gaiellaceae bacterium]